MKHCCIASLPKTFFLNHRCRRRRRWCSFNKYGETFHVRGKYCRARLIPLYGQAGNEQYLSLLELQLSVCFRCVGRNVLTKQDCVLVQEIVQSYISTSLFSLQMFIGLVLSVYLWQHVCWHIKHLDFPINRLHTFTQRNGSKSVHTKVVGTLWSLRAVFHRT